MHQRRIASLTLRLFAAWVIISCAANDLLGAPPKLYWVEEGVGIRRANLDGSQVETIFHTTTDVAYLTPSQSLGKMFYAIGSPTPQIWSADLDGQHRQLLATFDSANYIRGMAYDSVTQKLYWSSFHGYNSTNGMIRSANSDGSNVQTVLSLGDTRPFGMAIDSASGQMFWADTVAQIVERASLNGTSMTAITPALNSLASAQMAIDPFAHKLYWNAPEENKVYWSNLDGSQVTAIESMGGLVPYGSGIAVDHASGFLFWSETTTDMIFRANLDGSDPDVILSSGLSNPGSMFVLNTAPVPEPTSIALAAIAGGLFWLWRKR